MKKKNWRYFVIMRSFNTVNNFRFYYDIQTDECKPFVYTGCGGNKNNFYTSDFCERNCKGKKEYKPITSRSKLQLMMNVTRHGFM